MKKITSLVVGLVLVLNLFLGLGSTLLAEEKGSMDQVTSDTYYNTTDDDDDGGFRA